MATHSGTLVWKIPWKEEPGRLQSMGSQRELSDFTFTFTFTFMHWRRKWQPTPVLLSGKSHGRRSLVCYSPWGCKVSDSNTAELLHFHFLVAQLVKNPCLQCGRPGFDPWVGKTPWRREQLPTPVFWPREIHGLNSPWSRRVRHDWATFTSLTS